MSEKTYCAHYLSKYLPITENWIYRIIINHHDFNPIVLCRKKDNLHLFPFSGIFCLYDFNLISRLYEIVLFKILGYFIFFKKTCIKNKVKILHVHFGYQGVKFTGLKRKLRLPMICSFYGYDAFTYPRINNNIKKYRKLFRYADKILVLGPYMKEELVKSGCQEDKIVIQHLGIDTGKIKFIERNFSVNKNMRFLIASSFVPKKGIDLAIKALSEFREKYNFTLDIIGDGPLKNDILKLIDDLKMNDQIHLHGYKPYDFFIELAYTCDVFIQASRTAANNDKEGTPMAIVDAMATGLPVISTKHSDIPEMVIEDVTGFLAEENDLKSLTGAFQKLFNNIEKLSAISTNCRERVENEFNCEKQTLKLEKIYRSLI